MDNLSNFLRMMQSLGLEINIVYDIGACKGVWSQKTKNEVLPNANFFLFEANPAYVEDLIKTGFSYCSTVLSNPGREYVDFFNGTNTGDSYYQENSKHYDNQSTIKLKCTTLDNWVKEFKLPIPNLIKLDTQGSELDILKGSANIIDKVDMVYTECPILCYNKGAPKIQDYLDFFKSKNFIPVDLLEVHKFESMLLQVDIMFMRKEIKEQYMSPTDVFRPFD